MHFYRLSHSELVGIKKVTVCSSLRLLKPKCPIEYRAIKRSSINLTRILFQYIYFSYTMKTSNILRVLRIILVILPEHQSDTKVFTMTMEILPEPTSNKLCGNPDGGRSCNKVLKLKNFKKDENASFQEQEKYEHVGPKVTSTQDGKRSQDGDKRLYSADDLKKLKDYMQVKLKGISLSLKSKDHYAYHKLYSKSQDHKQRPKAFIEC
ncbi:hypothetical protein Tco_0487042 [Tanacetum coccineum]